MEQAQRSARDRGLGPRRPSVGSLQAEPAHEFDLVFSNKTAFDPLCLEVRAKLVPGGVRVWQQRTNIPKDSDNCAPLHSSPENVGLHVSNDHLL